MIKIIEEKGRYDLEVEGKLGDILQEYSSITQSLIQKRNTKKPYRNSL